MTAPHGKGVLKQLYFSVCLASVHHANILPNHWTEFNQTCYMASPHGKGVQERVHLSICSPIMLLATGARSMGISDGILVYFAEVLLN